MTLSSLINNRGKAVTTPGIAVRVREALTRHPQESYSLSDQSTWMRPGYGAAK